MKIIEQRVQLGGSQGVAANVKTASSTCTCAIDGFLRERQKPSRALAHNIGTSCLCQFGRVSYRHA